MLRVNEFAKLLYDTSSGCSQGEAVRDCADCRSVTPCAVHTPEARARIAAHAVSLETFKRLADALEYRRGEFLTPSGEAATRERVATVDPCEGKPGDVLATTGGDVSASPDRALPDGWVHCCNCQGDHAPPACRPDDANRIHQRLGAKWMCEALVRWLRTSGLACAADIERRWEDDAFWRPR